MPDYMSTESKVIDILESGIRPLKKESKKMRQRIKELDAIDDDTHSLD